MIDRSKMSKLGFGLMRLPETDGRIDLPQVCRMVDAYMEKGFHYFDTAYVYHGGNSERVIKDALVSRYPRESFQLATKLPAWAMKGPEDRDCIFNEQLDRCGVDYFDFYLLHSLEDGNNYDTLEQMADNLNTFSNFEPLSQVEYGTISTVVRKIQDMPLISCTACRYCCDGCPAGICIPDIFRALNTARLYPKDNRPKLFYRNLAEAGSGKASACVACGQCENVCPQHLPIIKLMKEVVNTLEK